MRNRQKFLHFWNLNASTMGEKQLRIGTVYGGVNYRRGRVNGGDEGEGIWLMCSIYMYEIER
jgi:hypothetical protein